MPEDMRQAFDNKFTEMLNNFMLTWGEYIDDSVEVETMITDSFDGWVNDSGFFEG